MKMPNSSPAPDRIRQLRKKAGLSRAEAAALVYRSPRSWENWEQGRTKMELGTWELFCFKVDLLEVQKDCEKFRSDSAAAAAERSVARRGSATRP